jgi:hypothetical protein
MISLVQKYLEINHFSSQKKVFEDLFQSHPNYPSVFAITDTLDLLAIENVAINVLKEQLIELPDSFLAIFNQRLVLVSKTPSLINIETEKGEQLNLSFNEFIEDWSGIIIAVEPNTIIIREGGNRNFRGLLFCLPAIALIALSVFYYRYGLADFIFLFTSLSGLIFSVFIVQEKLDFKNEIVSKFCNITFNTSCDSVIKSEKGEFNKWLSFSDLPVLFFSVNTLSLLLQPAGSSNVIGILSFFSLPVIVYSIWLQKIQLKKWCALCLAVSFLLVLQSIIWVFVKQSFLGLSLTGLFAYSFSLISITSLWLAIKPILESKNKTDQSLKDLKKFKRNFDVFNFLSKEIPVMEGCSQLEGLQFGSSNADVKLILILSPSCGHCHKACQEAFELVAKYPKKIFLNILFNINPENYDNPYKVVVESLLAINNSDVNKLQDAIADWHIKQIGLEAWKDKWKVDAASIRVNHQIEQQYKWCLGNEFNYTPVKIVNGKLFPNEYSVNELKYFLNSFSEEKEDIETILLESIQ